MFTYLREALTARFIPKGNPEPQNVRRVEIQTLTLFFHTLTPTRRGPRHENMKTCWKPKIIRSSKNSLPQYILKFFYDILVSVENEGGLKLKSDWRYLNVFKKEFIIESDTKKERIQIPDKIELGSIYFKESETKARNFLKNLRHAFAHNYIEIEKNSILKIALPSLNRKNGSMKLACYIAFDDLKEMVDVLKNFESKNKSKRIKRKLK